MNPLFNRKGGKFFLHKKIVPMILDTTIYVEPFVGGGSIYFNTKKVNTEVINDLDTELIRIYRYVKDCGEFSHLIKKYTREDFFNIYDSKPTTEKEYIERRVLVKNLSYLSCGARCYDNFGAKITKHRTDNFMKCHQRLKDTIIENTDYKDIITKYDTPDTFFYLDPPYENSKKTVGDYTDIDLSELADILSTIKGKFLLSLNDSPRTRELFKDFIITEMNTRYCFKIRKVNELLIRNY